MLAFSSTASNLVFGDGNSPPLGLPQTGSFDGSDAFTVTRVGVRRDAHAQRSLARARTGARTGVEPRRDRELAGERERALVRAGAGGGDRARRRARRGRGRRSCRRALERRVTAAPGSGGQGGEAQIEGEGDRQDGHRQHGRDADGGHAWGGTDAADARARSPLRLAGARTGRVLGDGHGHVLRAGTRDADGHDPGDVRAREEEEPQEALCQGQRQEQAALTRGQGERADAGSRPRRAGTDDLRPRVRPAVHRSPCGSRSWCSRSCCPLRWRPRAPMPREPGKPRPGAWKRSCRPSGRANRTKHTTDSSRSASAKSATSSSGRPTGGC